MHFHPVVQKKIWTQFQYFIDFIQEFQEEKKEKVLGKEWFISFEEMA